MNHKLTEIVFILDRSGSMGGLEADTIGGFNGFVKKQAALGRTLLTTILFDDHYEILHDQIDARNTVLTKETYFTRGTTALLDAIGKTINKIGGRLNKTPEHERPGKVIFIITTDGLENASREFTYTKIKEMINHQTEKYSWEFVFLGANIDVIEEGDKLGICSDYTCEYEATSVGTRKMFYAAENICYGLRKSKYGDLND